jgi:CrcB protein
LIPAYFVPVLALGAVGATSRYLLDAYVGARFPSTLPWGTFMVNMSGSFLLGLLTGLVTFAGGPGALKVILGTGFCGAYTTFSTFSFETVRLIEERELYEAAANVLGSLAVGIISAGAGLALGAYL